MIGLFDGKKSGVSVRHVLNINVLCISPEECCVAIKMPSSGLIKVDNAIDTKRVNIFPAYRIEKNCSYTVVIEQFLQSRVAMYFQNSLGALVIPLLISSGTEYPFS